MKTIIIDVLFGIVVIIIVTILEFLVTLPFGEPSEFDIPENYASFINRELLLTALPAFLTTFGLSWLRKIKNKSDAIRRSIIWTTMLALNYIVIGFGNDNLPLIFGAIGIYVLLLCAFAGPILYAKIKNFRRVPGL